MSNDKTGSEGAESANAGPEESAGGATALIFLVGFMGAGKTTVGEALAARLNLPLVDLDGLIEKRAGKAVPEIFAEFGEADFRSLETETLRQCVGLNRAVVAVGGGAFTLEVNRRIIRGAGRSVWLD